MCGVVPYPTALVLPDVDHRRLHLVHRWHEQPGRHGRLSRVCPVRQYSGAAGAGSCTACADDYVAAAGSSSFTACTTSYFNPPATAAVACTPCPVGTAYGSRTVATMSCNTCAASQYATTTGSLTRAKCAAGLYSIVTSARGVRAPVASASTASAAARHARRAASATSTSR